MKQKTHSGAKKRLKVRKSGSVVAQKACKNHLLDNKSKRQKKSFTSGYPVSETRSKSLRRLLPGTMQPQAKRKARKAARTAGEAAA